MKSMRFYVVVVAMILFASYETMKAQVTIGADKLPETYSVLQLEGKYGEDQYGGLRMPQLTTAQRDLLKIEDLNGKEGADKAQGLTIFNVDKDCIEFWSMQEQA